MSSERFREFCREMKYDFHDGVSVVYIMFLEGLFYESCYDFVMAIIKRLCALLEPSGTSGLPGATYGGFRTVPFQG